MEFPGPWFSRHMEAAQEILIPQDLDGFTMVLSLPHDALQFPPKKTSCLAAFSPVQCRRRQQNMGGFFWALL